MSRGKNESRQDSGTPQGHDEQPAAAGTNRNVGWNSGAGPDPWHVDSSLPAAEQLSGIDNAADTEDAVEPEPIDDAVDDFSEAQTELPARRIEAMAAEQSGPESEAGKETRPRSQTIARKQMLRERRRLIAQGGLPEVLEYERPKHRSDCRDDRRPCLYVACRYHLFLDVNPVTGSIKINFPGMEIWQLEETCALDVAERGGVTLEEVGDIMNLTRERIRQVEASGLDKLRTGEAALASFLDGEEIVVGGPGTPGHHRLVVLDD